MRAGRLALVLLLASIFVGITFEGATLPKPEQSTVRVLYAGSLVPVMEKSLGPGFSARYGTKYEGEGHGAVQNANMVLDGQRRPDVFVSAGAEPVVMLMEKKPPLADWYVSVAGAELVIAYAPKSPFVRDFEEAVVGSKLWYDVVAGAGVRFLRTDPRLDPKGYYFVIAVKLAERYYRDPYLSRRLLGEGSSSKIVPEEVLMTSLEMGQADAAVAYRHEAVARELPYVVLPSEISFNDPRLTGWYTEGSYMLPNGRAVNGVPIVFVATVPNTAANVRGAIDFVEYLLSPEASRTLETHGFLKTPPVTQGDISKLPNRLLNKMEDARP